MFSLIYSHVCGKKGNRAGKPTTKRIRRTVESVYRDLGSYFFRRAHRMSYSCFWKLHELLKDGIAGALRNKSQKQRVKRMAFLKRGPGRKVTNPHPLPQNGLIHTSVRLAVALRYFAGGAFYDLAPLYGVGMTDVKLSVWYVVWAVNALKSLEIEYPSDHQEQLAIAKEFEKCSDAGFSRCAGAVDGVLLWLHRPTERDCIKSKVDSSKYRCARKHKFGFNLQCVSDVRGRIRDFSITFPASSSDVLAFEASGLYKKMALGNFLAPNLCIFGDNAYINTPFLATPYPNVHEGEKDWYNFYHSQLRIRVECCFGMWVQRWAILQAAIPCGIRLHRAIDLSLCLAKLHNFCIDAGDTEIADGLFRDLHNVRTAEGGSIPLEIDPVTGSRIPRQLLGTGHHRLDYPPGRSGYESMVLPREEMLNEVIATRMQRPTVSARRH